MRTRRTRGWCQKSPDLKTARMKLKNSGYGNFGAGITNPVSKMSNFNLVLSYGTFVPHGLQSPPPPKRPRKNIFHQRCRHFIYTTPPTIRNTRYLHDTLPTLPRFYVLPQKESPNCVPVTLSIKQELLLLANFISFFFLLRPPARASTPAGSTPCLLYTSPSPRDGLLSRMPSSA